MASRHRGRRSAQTKCAKNSGHYPDLGGPDAGLLEGQRQLARRCATIVIECEKMEGDAAAGGEIDLERYAP